MAVSGNSIAIKSFQSFVVNEDLLQKVTEAVRKGEQQAHSSGEVKSIEVFYHGFRQNISIGRVYIVPASVCNKPEDFPIALLFGTVVRLLNLGEETADLIQLKTGGEFDDTTDVQSHLDALKEQAFTTADGKGTSLIVFAPAWSGIREYVAFQYTDDEEKLANLLRHQIFSCYYNPAVSSGFDALMTVADTWKLDVADITPKLTYPALTENPLRAFPELFKAAANKKRTFLTAKTADAIAQNQIEPEEMNVFQALGEALGNILKPKVKSPQEAAESDYKGPEKGAEVPKSDDGTGPKKEAAKKEAVGALPVKPVPPAPDEVPEPAPPTPSVVAAKKQAVVDIGMRFVVKQDNQIRFGPGTMNDCLDFILEDSGNGIGMSRGGYEIEETGGQKTPVEQALTMKHPAMASNKQADTADNPANEAGGKAHIIHPKTDAEKANTRGTEPEMAPDKNPGSKEAAMSKVAYVSFCKGHKNSKGELAEWCVKSHETGKILSSHTSEGAAKKHLQDMHAHSGAKKAYGVHPADCTCGFCEKKGDISKKDEKEKKDAGLKDPFAPKSMPGTPMSQGEMEAQQDFVSEMGPAGDVVTEQDEVERNTPKEYRDRSYKGGASKKADTADNPANEKDGEGAMDPKTNQEKANTQGTPPPGKTAAPWSNDWHQRPNESMNDMFNKTNSMSAKEPDGVNFSNGHRNHAASKTATFVPICPTHGIVTPVEFGGSSVCPECYEKVTFVSESSPMTAAAKAAYAEMKCPWCKKNTATKPSPDSPTYHCPCGWDSEKDKGIEPSKRGAQKTAADDQWKAQQALSAINDFYALVFDETVMLNEMPQEAIAQAIKELEGSMNPSLQKAKLMLERAASSPDDTSAADFVDNAQAILHRFLDEGRPMDEADEVADEIARPVDEGESGLVASLRSRKEAQKREAKLRKLRSGKGEDFGDIFSEVLGSKLAAPIEPDLNEAKSEIMGETKAELSKEKEEAAPEVSTQTTEPIELSDQKASPDAGGVPRTAGDISISISTGDGSSKVKSKLPLGDGPEDKGGEKKTKKEEKADEKKNKQDSKAKEKSDKGKDKKKKAEQVAPDISSAREKLNHGAKSNLSNNPEATQTVNPIDLDKKATLARKKAELEGIQGLLNAKKADLTPSQKELKAQGKCIVPLGCYTKSGDRACPQGCPCEKCHEHNRKEASDVTPSVAQAKSELQGQTKAQLADNPDATQTVNPIDLDKKAAKKTRLEKLYERRPDLKERWKKEACAPVGDDMDEAIDMELLFGELADLGANLPSISDEEMKMVEAPQVGEGGLNNEPKAKDASALARELWGG
jgi:phage FluMu protein Com